MVFLKAHAKTASPRPLAKWRGRTTGRAFARGMYQSTATIWLVCAVAAGEQGIGDT